jgi:hypothetical protein
VASGEVVWNDVGGAPAGGVEPGGEDVAWASAAAPPPSIKATAIALPKNAIGPKPLPSAAALPKFAAPNQ